MDNINEKIRQKEILFLLISGQVKKFVNEFNVIQIQLAELYRIK